MGISGTKYAIKMCRHTVLDVYLPNSLNVYKKTLAKWIE